MVPRSMKTWLTRLFRPLNGLLSLAAFLLTILVIGIGAGLYTAATGHGVGLLRQAATVAGDVLSGQHTDHIALDLAAFPIESRLGGTAHVTVRSTDGARRSFYFLLNPGLALDDVRVFDDGGAELAAATYRLALFVIVQLDEPVPENRRIRMAFTYEGTPSLQLLGGDSASFRDDRILLGPETFWYPYDTQSFFELEARLVMPAHLTAVHNGVAESRVERGDVQHLRWRSERPLAGTALVAGDFVAHEIRNDDHLFRVFLPPQSPLDAASIAASLAAAHASHTEWFGPSGYSRYTVFVDSGVRRAFNDGSGLMAAAPRYFRDGDRGFHLLAHEIAHVWWGGTVSERWLQPGSGGQWIVEGLASTAAALATASRYGDRGLERVRLDHFFDPRRQGVVADMSFLDNVLSIGDTRDTIYRKGGYVGLMLRQELGDDAFGRGMRAVIETFRYRQASDHDLQRVLEETTGRDLGAFFDEWLRSDRLPDLAWETANDGRLVLTNRGELPIAAPVPVAITAADGTTTRRSLRVGESLAMPTADAVAVVDPDLLWADMVRTNNRHPRIEPPFAVAARRDEQLVALGGGRAWEATTLQWQDVDGGVRETWDFRRGLVAPPVWSQDGEAALVEVSTADGPADIVKLERGGKRRSVGRGRDAVFDGDGILLASEAGTIDRIAADGTTSTWLERDGWELFGPQPSPSGRYVLYQAARGSRLELRVHDRELDENRLLHAGERDSVITLWARDDTGVYLGLGHGAAWQIVRLALEPASAIVLATDIGSLRALSLSPGGDQLAVAAAAPLAYPFPRHTIYVLDVQSQEVRSLDVPGADVRHLSWSDPRELVAVVRTVPADASPRVPPESRLVRLALDAPPAEPAGN